VPYQPFVDCLSWYFRNCPQAELRSQLAAIGGGAELAPFVPELRNRIPDLPSPPPMDPEGQRYRLFEAVAAMLAVASRARPMLLIFDDLHWADKPTVLLLRHIMRSARTASFTIIATYRESELGRAHPLAELLIMLRRQPRVTRLVLRGLNITHVRALVDSIVGPNVPSQLPQAVMDSTDGNPFFATEMLQHLKETGAIVGVGGMMGKDHRDRGSWVVGGDQGGHRPTAVSAKRSMQSSAQRCVHCRSRIRCYSPRSHRRSARQRAVGRG